MGKDKALLAYRGRTFLETIVATLREAGIPRIAVVLGHHADQIRRAANLQGAEVVVNQNYALGQTSSLQAGLRALASQEIEAVVLCPVDHPAVSPETIINILDSYKINKSAVVIPTFQNRRGHPALIARALFDELLSLGADVGANRILRQHREATRFVEVGDRGILLDVDDAETCRELPQ